MDSKSKITSNEFVTIFISFFVFIFFISIGFTLLPFIIMYSPSKFLMGMIALGITAVVTIVVVSIMRWRYDINELPVFKTALKLVGIISLFPLVVSVPLFIMQFQNQPEKVFNNIFMIICWLFVIGVVAYIMLKIGNYKRNNSSHL